MGLVTDRSLALDGGWFSHHLTETNTAVGRLFWIPEMWAWRAPGAGPRPPPRPSSWVGQKPSCLSGPRALSFSLPPKSAPGWSPAFLITAEGAKEGARGRIRRSREPVGRRVKPQQLRGSQQGKGVSLFGSQKSYLRLTRLTPGAAALGSSAGARPSLDHLLWLLDAAHGACLQSSTYKARRAMEPVSHPTPQTHPPPPHVHLRTLVMTLHPPRYWGTVSLRPADGQH